MNKISLLFGLLAIFSCTTNRSKEIEQAMSNYDKYLLHQNVDSIANTFLPDGKLGGEGQAFIVGKDSIHKFLKSFEGVKVLENISISQSIQMNSDSANQKGMYKQVITLLEKGDTLELGGQFEATWVEIDKSWKLKRMYTSDYTHKKISHAN